MDSPDSPPDAVQSDSQPEVNDDAARDTGEGAGGDSRPAPTGSPQPMLELQRRWEVLFWTGALKATFPHRPPIDVRRMAEAQVDRRPVTDG